MKKLVMIGFLMAFLALLPTTTKAQEIYDFIAGQHEDVGNITVWNDAEYLYVGYDTISGWWALQETHLHVAENTGGHPPTKDQIPQKNGNPIPGQFAFQEPYDSDTTWAVYRIPLEGEITGAKKNDDPVAYDWDPGDELFIAAHGVVGICDCNDLNDVLPETVTADVVYPGTESYFIVTITGDGILNGEHKGWCADADDLIEGDAEHLGEVYSTICEDVLDIPEDLIVYDSNLPSVNWLLNNWESPYTAGDVQYAIWVLLSGHVPADLSSISTNPLWPADQAYDETRALELVAAAEANDEFMPVCGEVMAVVFIPPPFNANPETPRQTVLIEVPAPCCETAWGAMPGGPPWDDFPFPGKNWALYITYTVVGL